MKVFLLLYYHGLTFYCTKYSVQWIDIRLLCIIYLPIFPLYLINEMSSVILSKVNKGMRLLWLMMVGNIRMITTKSESVGIRNCKLRLRRRNLKQQEVLSLDRTYYEIMPERR